MATNIRQFELSLRQFSNKVLPQEIGKTLRLIGFQTLAGIVQKTPVDTGRARANWQVEVNTLTPSATEDTDPGGGKAISSGVGVIGQVKAGDTIYISNHLPYINKLENGHSKQAPQGMVALTLAEVQAQFK